MAIRSAFLSLPREVRDEIYGHYVRTDGGYVCDSEMLIARTLNVNSSGSSSSSRAGHLGNVAAVLKRHDGLPIDCGLSLTCKIVAEEMRGLALRNTITFSTATSQDFRTRALHFDILMRSIDLNQEFIFHRTGFTIPDIARDQLKLAYPQFSSLLENLKDRYPLAEVLQRRGPYGEAPSQYRAFSREALAAASVEEIRRDDNDIRQRFSAWESAMRCSPDIMPLNTLRIAQCHVSHWTIPTDDVLNRLKECVKPDVAWRLLCAETGRDRSNHRFSAAAVAVHFLQSIPEELRRQLRSIILDEDREAMVNPQCHALDLVPFCKQNPHLRIERRVNLWRNALQPDPTFDTPSSRYEATRPPGGLKDRLITRNVSQWVVEALALATAGMPPASFALVLDGQPVPGLCAEIFQKTVQRDVAWQTTWFESVDRDIVPPTEWFLEQVTWDNPQARVGHQTGYFYKGFPHAMRDIVEAGSVARCNFDPGETWNVERIVEDHQTWSPEWWQAAWADHEPKRWFPVAPLPAFKTLLEEDLVPRPGKKKKKLSMAERRRRMQIETDDLRSWLRRTSGSSRRRHDGGNLRF
ncbi:hypothetical protein CFIO01_06717 [Colletotrichum fioriniae PJ7]|uniref:Uncharacterized protein n=1 Tax=Colletotrichum fioriniae PJ7 TaxID=1445577 RepID=A0A010Q5G7_9PEZI|nr:hypothetical protein CFIO01_06717 [Colletotrichum fioriniae PJ7]